jgi:hypothetical protein
MRSITLAVLFASAVLSGVAAGQAKDSRAPNVSPREPYRVPPSIFESGPPAAAPKRVKQPVADAPAPAVKIETAASSDPSPVPTVDRPSTPELPLKDITPEEFASIKVGAAEKDLAAVLGPAESRVTIPDDDGHLRSYCQYWSKGKLVGTILVDNGRVIAVEPRNH